MSITKTFNKSFEMVAMSKIRIDGKYQRNLSNTKAKKIAKNFDPRGIGLLFVSKREDGYYYIMDGQHRFTALKMLGVELAPCMVFEGMSLVDEAVSFEVYNNSKNPDPMDKGKARLVAGEEVAVEINEIVEEQGFKLDTEKTGSGIRAFGALEKIFKHGGAEALREVLFVISESFGNNEKQAQTGYVLTGIYEFIKDYKGEYDTTQLIFRLRKATLERLLAKSVSIYQALGCERVKGMKMAIVQFYDHGRRYRLSNLPKEKEKAEN